MSVRYALLGLLYQQPMHGYELGKQLAATVGAQWDVKPGQIANTLARLRQEDLVDYELAEGDDAPERKVFFLTPAGQAELQDWYLRPEARDYRLQDSFYMKLVLSLVRGPVAPEQVLMVQRRALFQELHEATDLRRRADPQHELPWVLLLESVIMHLEADLRWIEMCEARLPDLKRYTPPLPPPARPRGRPKRVLSEAGG